MGIFFGRPKSEEKMFEDRTRYRERPYQAGAGPTFYVVGAQGEKIFRKPGPETLERVQFRGVERADPFRGLVLPMMEGYGGPPIYMGEESVGTAPRLPTVYRIPPQRPPTLQSASYGIAPLFASKSRSARSRTRK